MENLSIPLIGLCLIIGILIGAMGKKTTRVREKHYPNGGFPRPKVMPAPQKQKNKN